MALIGTDKLIYKSQFGDYVTSKLNNMKYTQQQQQRFFSL